MMRSSRIDSLADDLAFFVTFSDGERYTVDLREFAVGGSTETIPKKARRFWGGNFKGRRKFAYQFAKMIRAEAPPKHTTAQYRTGLRHLFRFLDNEAATGSTEVADLSDLTDAHGEAFSKWIGPNRPSAYRIGKAVVDAMRAFHKMPRLAWPPREHDHNHQDEAISPQAARAIYQIAKSECREIKRMFKEGRQLAQLGCMAGNLKRDAPHWAKAETRAHLVATATLDRLPTKSELKQLGYYRILHNFKGPGPTYLAPGIGVRAKRGWSAALRWLHPSFHDMAILLWLFIIGTGWNLSTALALDVSEERKWCLRHPTNSKFVILHSYKRRAKRRQLAFSMTIPEFHPHQIIRFVIDITKSLRANVQHELEHIVAKHESNPTPELASRIVRLKRKVRNPWLFHVPNRFGVVSSITESPKLASIIRKAAQRQGKLHNFPEIASITMSDPRDTWIQYAYVQSGYRVLIAQLAGFHQKGSTTRHYLKLIQYRARSEKKLRHFHSVLVSEIAAGEIVDPTRLKLLLDRGTITQAQQDRLLDHRLRTRLGTACIDPYAPPRDVAPDHTSGTLCRIQRCLGCPHCFIFAESLPGLARTYAELNHIKRTSPLTAWISSSYADELDSITKALELFPPNDVRESIEHWTRKLRSGDIIAHDTFPLY